MSFEKAALKLRSIRQEHLLRHWEALDESQRFHLLGQIEALDLELFRRQQSLLAIEADRSDDNYEAFDAYRSCGQRDDQERGLELIASGRLGCLLVAGGQGTRLGFNGPKGIYPVSLIKHKSLFQLFAEKTVAAGKRAGRQLPLAVMTSPLNHEATVDFFQQHGNFGLSPEQLSFFSQSTLPFLDVSGNLFLERPDSIAMGPDGNGSSLQGLIDAGIWQKWKLSGVQYLNYILIDNPIADPFDAELVGYHSRQGGEITVKCTPRLTADEKVGLLVWRGKQLEVVEYSELPERERLAKLPDGSLKHVCANISLFCFSADFIDRLQGASLPLHLAFKDVTALQTKAWKFEKFIFDVLPIARHVQALMYPREACFSPLKNGDDFPRVQKALQCMDRTVYGRIAGLPPPDRPFELSQDFYYPTPHLLAEWHHKQLPDQDYISPDSKN